MTLLATIDHHGERHEFHGDPVAGMCLITLRRGDERLDSWRVPREATKRVIREVRDELLPGRTLVFAYPGADPWPTHTQAGQPQEGARVDAMPGRAGEMRRGEQSGEGWGPGVISYADGTTERGPRGMSACFARHPAEDLLGEDER
jgi:hypothetical protein